MAIAINVYPNLSPRIIEISGTTSASVQEIVNLTRAWEDTERGMYYPYLIDAAGKEDLGNDVYVGITATLQNAQIAFVPETASESTGTVTTPDSNGLVLYDSGADFVGDGVTKGATVINETDGSVGTVLSIDSQYQLTLMEALADGDDNQFGNGDGYKVFNKVSCEVSGGNLVAVDEYGTSMSAFMPSAFTHVTRTSSASATLQEQADIQYSSFGGRVWVDTSGSNTGTTFPSGTPRQAVNNFADALTIAAERGFTTIQILGDALLDSGSNFSNFTVRGDSQERTTITVSADANVTNTVFENCTLTGTLDGGNIVKDCQVDDLTYFNGIIQNCIMLDATVTLAGGADAHFIDCDSGVIGAGAVYVDMGGSGQTLGVRGYSGGIKIKNKTGSEDVSMDFNSGRLTLEDTVTNGTFYVRGIVDVVDNSDGATINKEALINIDQIDAEVNEAKIAILTDAISG